MKKIHRRMVSFLLAFITTYLLACSSHTLMVLSELQRVGVTLDGDIWVKSVSRDWLNLAAVYAPIIAVTLLLAFVVVSALRFHVSTYGKRISYWIFPVAGALAMLVMLKLVTFFFDMHIIAGARGGLGLSLQLFAGWCGGLVYASSIKYLRMHRQKRRHKGRRHQTHSNKQVITR